MDDDIWVNPTGLATEAILHSPKEIWMLGAMGRPSQVNYLVYGGALVLSGAAVDMMSPENVMRWASLWEYACSIKGCCDIMGGPQCWNQAQFARDFDMCNSKLVSHCGDASDFASFSYCRDDLVLKDTENQCSYMHTRPEFPVPMYYNSDRWDKHHGDDHLLSFMVRVPLQGKLISISQDRMAWKFRSANITNMCDGADPIISQHHLEAANIYKWDKLWQTSPKWCTGFAALPTRNLQQATTSDSLNG